MEILVATVSMNVSEGVRCNFSFSLLLNHCENSGLLKLSQTRGSHMKNVFQIWQFSDGWRQSTLGSYTVGNRSYLFVRETRSVQWKRIVLFRDVSASCSIPATPSSSIEACSSTKEYSVQLIRVTPWETLGSHWIKRSLLHGVVPRNYAGRKKRRWKSTPTTTTKTTVSTTTITTTEGPSESLAGFFRASPMGSDSDLQILRDFNILRYILGEISPLLVKLQLQLLCQWSFSIYVVFQRMPVLSAEHCKTRNHWRVWVLTWPRFVYFKKTANSSGYSLSSVCSLR